MLRWFTRRGCRVDATATAEALANKQIEAFCWLRQLDPPCPWDWRVPGWVLNQYPQRQSPRNALRHLFEAMEGVAPDKFQNIILGLLKGLPDVQKAYIATNIIDAVAASGHEAIMELLQTSCLNLPCDATIFAAAAGAGCTPMLQYLRSLDPPCPWDAHSMFGCSWSWGTFPYSRICERLTPPAPGKPQLVQLQREVATFPYCSIYERSTLHAHGMQKPAVQPVAMTAWTSSHGCAGMAARGQQIAAWTHCSACRTNLRMRLPGKCLPGFEVKTPLAHGVQTAAFWPPNPVCFQCSGSLMEAPRVDGHARIAEHPHASQWMWYLQISQRTTGLVPAGRCLRACKITSRLATGTQMLSRESCLVCQTSAL